MLVDLNQIFLRMLGIYFLKPAYSHRVKNVYNTENRKNQCCTSLYFVEVINQ